MITAPDGWADWLSTQLQPAAANQDLVATLGLLSAVLVLNLVLGRLIRRTEWASEEVKLRWRSQARLLIFVVLCFGLLLIWGKELQTLALSMVAVAVALVIATKELITCITGSLLRFGAKSFAVGDRVEIGGLQGDVIDTGLLATKLLETGPAHDRTGRLVVVPNSVLLTERVINETFTNDYVLHVFSVPLAEGADWRHAEQVLLQAARDATARYTARTRHSLAEVDKQHLPKKKPSKTLRGEPTILLRVADKGLVELIARVPTPARDKGSVEQEIVRQYLSRMTASANAPPAEPSSEAQSHPEKPNTRPIS